MPKNTTPRQRQRQRRRRRIYYIYFKRFFDFSLSLAALIFISPVFLLIAILVRVKLGGPVIFCQERPGKEEKIFRLYKFRTMTDERGADGELLPDEARLTNFGRLLRSTSLDELPELYNILRGDMSLVGPRPLLVSYLPLYSDEQKRRHEVRPGLSGLAQVSGRNLLSWDDRFQLDVEYIDNITFVGDIKIMFLTIKNILRRDGISSETAATMEPFKGAEQRAETAKV
ncbi:MAG: sugar transferase [Clostridiales bacterium]|jgi:lipopolysaccharide/colanic/teichoic acid biosynthesis glycosyltransferase|nr:sugar transferase [Clostridiales bacterium]